MIRHPTAGRRRVMRPELTPLIDVIFLLLIYFFLSTTYAAPESALQPALLAQREAPGRSADLQPQIVDAALVDGLPAYTISGQTFRDAPSLGAMLRTLPKEMGVFVRSDGQVSVGWTVGAVQAATDAGFTRITYVPARPGGAR
jgi:biopolymer transport protein ExbD